MIRSASFFILSLVLHTTALVYPVSFRDSGQVETIQVTILPMEQEGGADGGGGHGMPARQADSKSHRPASRIVEPRVKPQSLANPEPAGLPANSIETVSNSSIELASAMADSTDFVPTPISNSAGDDAAGSAIGFGRTVNGDGLVSYDTGFGRGSGSGTGSGLSEAIDLTRARYLETPRPAYPEIARREGREGRVLLRVLVDDQGRTKTVEISSSSGSEALDRAAAEAVKRWHFHPARYDDKAVESWLRIPIEFRLADIKSR